MYLNRPERNRLTMAAGVALAAAIGLAGGMAAPLPQAVTDPRYELAVIVDGEAHIADYGLTLADCVDRWQEYPPVGFGLECNRTY